ncbi:hypothetical protein GCM10017710_20560 [Arthrobacter ramosus]
MEAVAASVAVLTAFTGDADTSENTDPLHGSDPLRRLADGCLDGLAEVARLEARTAALKARLAADYVQAARALAAPASSPQESTAQELALLAEVACVLTVSERTAGAFLSETQALTTVLPLTLAALGSGTVSWQHARIIIDETTGLDPAAAAGLEAHFLDPGAPNPARGCPAGDLVPSRFRAKARTWRERHHPVGIEERHAQKAEHRRVEYLPDRDGMAWLSAHLPADTAAGIWERTTAAARALQGPHETRTLAQLRADITATWLLTNNTSGTSAAMPDGGTPDGGTEPGRAGRVPSPRAQVLVTVPVLSLLGATEEPAILDGYGPIPPSMARRLIAEGADSFHRVLTDPRDGAPLEIGRSSYRLTKAQRQWLRLRDGKCPFPAATTTPWTTKQTTSWPGPREAPPASPTWASPAPNTTASNTGPHGPPPRPAKTTRPGGPHPHNGTTPANTRTGNHPAGHTTSRSPTRTWTWRQMHTRAKTCPHIRNRNCRRIPSPAGTPSPPHTPGPTPRTTTWTTWTTPTIRASQVS